QVRLRKNPNRFDHRIGQRRMALERREELLFCAKEDKRARFAHARGGVRLLREHAKKRWARLGIADRSERIGQERSQADVRERLGKRRNGCANFARSNCAQEIARKKKVHRSLRWCVATPPGRKLCIATSIATLGKRQRREPSPAKLSIEKKRLCARVGRVPPPNEGQRRKARYFRILVLLLCAAKLRDHALALEIVEHAGRFSAYIDICVIEQCSDVHVGIGIPLHSAPQSLRNLGPLPFVFA